MMSEKILWTNFCSTNKTYVFKYVNYQIGSPIIYSAVVL